MMTEDKYYIKYLKYKNLYLELNKQLGGEGNDMTLVEYINLVTELESPYLHNDDLSEFEIILSDLADINIIKYLQLYIIFLDITKKIPILDISQFDELIEEIDKWVDQIKQEPEPADYCPCDRMIIYHRNVHSINTLDKVNKYKVFQAVSKIDHRFSSFDNYTLKLLWSSYNDKPCPINPEIIKEFIDILLLIIKKELIYDGSRLIKSKNNTDSMYDVKGLNPDNFLSSLSNYIKKIDIEQNIRITEAVLDIIIDKLRGNELVGNKGLEHATWLEPNTWFDPDALSEDCKRKYSYFNEDIES